MFNNVFQSKDFFKRKSDKILSRRQNNYTDFHPIYVKRGTYLGYLNYRNILTASYEKCRSYLDKEFVKFFKLKKSFNSRLWELFLCDFILTKGFILDISKKEEGLPDFCLLNKDFKYWLEAVTPSEHHTIESLGDKSYDLLDISIPRYLRLSSVFVDKSEKRYSTYLKNGAKLTEPFIIAINGNSIDSWSTDKGILSILYGVGLSQVSIKTGITSYQKLSTLRKGNNSFDIAYFLKPEFSHVSGVIYLDSNIQFINDDMAVEHSRFQFIPNINAKNPVSHDFISKLGLHIPIEF